MKTTMTVTEFLASLAPSLDLYNTDATPKMVVERIRTDVKLAVAAGLLPKHMKLSITRRDYKSINVEIVAWQGQVLSTSYESYSRDCIVAKLAGEKEPELERDRSRGHNYDYRCSEEINSALSLLNSIASMHNFDRSDIQTDYFHVGYYLDVTANAIVALAERGVRLECDPAYAELVRLGVEAAKSLPANVVKATCGKFAPEHSNDWTLNDLIKIAAKLKGAKTATYNKRTYRWEAAA